MRWYCLLRVGASHARFYCAGNVLQGLCWQPGCTTEGARSALAWCQGDALKTLLATLEPFEVHVANEKKKTNYVHHQLERVFTGKVL